MPGPSANRIDRLELMAFDIRGEVPQFTDAVIGGEGPSGVFENEAVTRRMLNAHDALETQLL